MTTSQIEKVSTLRISDDVRCLDGLQKMEPLWSPVVANSGNQSQIGRGRNWRKHAETVAVGCNQLRPGLDGKEGVDGSSPSEGFVKCLQTGTSSCLFIQHADTFRTHLRDARRTATSGGVF
jgi:hypothetical protein